VPTYEKIGEGDPSKVRGGAKEGNLRPSAIKKVEETKKRKQKSEKTVQAK